MVGIVTDHPVFCQQQADRVLVAGRLQIGSSKAFNAMLDLENKVLSGRSVGDNTDREQKLCAAKQLLHHIGTVAHNSSMYYVPLLWLFQRSVSAGLAVTKLAGTLRLL